MTANLKQAFSLLDIAFLHSLLALFLIASVVLENRLNVKNEYIELAQENKVISNSLLAFWYKNRRLPCPAFMAQDIYDPLFGMEALYQDECLDLYGLVESNMGEFYVGAVPIKDLSLTIDSLTDPWGTKYFYVVRKDLVSSGNVTGGLIEHWFKDIVWFEVDALNIADGFWRSNSFGADIVLGNDYEIQSINDKNYLASTSYNWSLNTGYDYVLFNVVFTEETEFDIEFPSVTFVINYNDSKCDIQIEQADGSIFHDEVLCSISNRFVFKYDILTNNQAFEINDHEISIISLSGDSTVSISSAANKLIMGEVFFTHTANAILLNNYIEQEPLANYQDVIVVDNDGNNIDFSFLILSNLRNRYGGYNDKGELLKRGYASENLLLFDDLFLTKSFVFPCSQRDLECFKQNKDLDYSIKLENLF